MLERGEELAKEEAKLDEGFMAQVGAKTVHREREEVYAALHYAASFHCLVEEWKDCEELKPKPREKWVFVDRKREETKHRTDEDARKMHRTKIIVNKFGKMVKTTFGRS